MATENAFTNTPHNDQAIVTLPETVPDGTHGNVKILFTAALAHSKVARIVIKPRQVWDGTVRIYLNNGDDANAEANNSLLYEKKVTLSTLALNDELGWYEIECKNLNLRGHASTPERLLVGISATANSANGGIVITALGGDY